VWVAFRRALPRAAMALPRGDFASRAPLATYIPRHKPLDARRRRFPGQLSTPHFISFRTLPQKSSPKITNSAKRIRA